MPVSKLLKEFFFKLCLTLKSRRGETLNVGDAGTVVDGEAAKTGEETIPSVEQQVDWENEQNPYRKRYTDSQSQIQPLVRVLQQFAEYDHNAKTWKSKTQAANNQPALQDDDSELENYDPKFSKAVEAKARKIARAELNEWKKESAFLSEYNSGVQEARGRTISEFGTEFDFAKDGKMNTQSPLYQLANEIITNKYAIFNPDGTFQRYSNSEAEYLATTEAYAILAKRSRQQTNPDKAKLSAIQGKGTKSAGIKRKLAYDEYSKLSREQQDAYDLTENGG